MAIPSPDGGPAAPAALALAQLADDVSRALNSYAATLRRGGVIPLPVTQTDGADTPGPTPASRKPAALGERQQRLLALAELDNAAGLSNREIGQRLVITAPNSTAMTRRLTELGYLEAVPDERPVRYRRARASAAE